MMEVTDGGKEMDDEMDLLKSGKDWVLKWKPFGGELRAEGWRRGDDTYVEREWERCRILLTEE